MRTGNDDTVILERGRVEVSQGVREVRGACHGASLLPGKMVEVSRSGLSPVVGVDAESALAWRMGWIVFQDKPLADAPSAFSRASGWLVGHSSQIVRGKTMTSTVVGYETVDSSQDPNMRGCATWIRASASPMKSRSTRRPRRPQRRISVQAGPALRARAFAALARCQAMPRGRGRLTTIPE